jgi:hypothetical protein
MLYLVTPMLSSAWFHVSTTRAVLLLYAVALRLVGAVGAFPSYDVTANETPDVAKSSATTGMIVP